MTVARPSLAPPTTPVRVVRYTGAMTEADQPKELSDKDYDGYLQERKTLLAAEQDYAKSFDRWVITLAGGALGLSIAFLKDIAGPKATDVAWLVAAWILFGLCICALLVSMLVSQSGHEAFRAVLDEEATKDVPGFWLRVRKGQKHRWESTAIAVLNVVAIVTFVIGVISLAVFAALNL